MTIINLAGKEIELGQLYQHGFEKSRISDAGINAIARYLLQIPEIHNWWDTTRRSSSVGRTTAYAFYNEDTGLGLPTDWQWVWMVDKVVGAKQEYTGSLPKRLSKWVKLATGINISTESITKIANLCKVNEIMADHYEFDFVNEIDWNPGDFGEKENSCWWGSYAPAKKMLLDGGGIGIRFFREGRGYARAWIVPQTPNKDTFTIFNGYGFRDGYDSTAIIAKLVSEWLSMTYAQIELVNENRHSPSFYINGSTGYAIGPAEKINRLAPRFDYHFRDPRARYCISCDRIDTDGGIDHNDEHYCAKCAGDKFSRCEFCHQYHYKEEVHLWGNQQRPMCDECMKLNYWECPTCGRTSQGEQFCQKCASEEQFFANRKRREEEFLRKFFTNAPNGEFRASFDNVVYHFRVNSDGSFTGYQPEDRPVVEAPAAVMGTMVAGRVARVEAEEDFDFDEENN